MIEDAVYGAMTGTELEPSVVESLQSRKIYVLGPDLKARGIEGESLIEGVEIIDYDGFVNLAVESTNVQSWM